MGAQPGDCVDTNTFTLPNHESESLSEKQSAERIAEHFSLISQEFPPLDISKLPARVQAKLVCQDSPPIVRQEEVYSKIKSAKV